VNMFKKSRDENARNAEAEKKKLEKAAIKWLEWGYIYANIPSPCGRTMFGPTEQLQQNRRAGCFLMLNTVYMQRCNVRRLAGWASSTKMVMSLTAFPVWAIIRLDVHQ
jgi:hypothetical protein